MQKIAFLLLITSLGIACRKQHAIEPTLSYKGISKSLLLQNRQDSVIIDLAYEDGDGDLGSDTEDQIFVTDLRTDSLVATYRIPPFPNPDKKQYREGTIRLLLYSGCCMYANGTSCTINFSEPRDSVRYSIYIKDRAGHVSPAIYTDWLELDCTK